MPTGNPPPRRSKKTEEPKTIELEAERIEATTEPDATAASTEAEAPSAGETGPDTSTTQTTAGSASEPPRTPTPAKSGGSSGGAGAIAAGIVGGLVVLLGAGAAQYAGVIPNLGPAQTVKMPDYAGQIASLQQKLTAVEKKADNPPVADLTPLEERIKTIETAMSKLPVGDLTDVLAIKGKLDETAAKVAKFDTELASVANRLQQAEAKVNEPRDDIDVARAIASAGLKAGIDRGGPFQAELQTLASVAPNDDAVAALQAYAAKGVPSRAELIKSYPEAADAMLATLNKPVPGQSLSDRLFKSAFSVIKVRPVGNVEGTSPEAIVARIGDKLQNGDPDGALKEWAGLPDTMKAAGSDFHAALEARVKVEALVGKALEHAVKTTGKQG